jgi:ParB family chromosome partitioning protein
VQKEFADRDDAIEWMINNQLGRRNLNDYQRGVLALRMKPIIEARADAARIEGNAIGGGKSSENSHATSHIRTDEAVASLANISSNTIRKIEQLEKEALPEVKEWAATGEVSINLAAQFAALPVEAQQEAIASITKNTEVPKEVIRDAVRAHVANNSGNNEWYTPSLYVEAARKAMGGIDLDPASSEIANRTVKAKIIFTAEDDGRTQTGRGRVWMNPPYAQPLMNDFAEAVSSKYESGEIKQACVLVNNATETQWFQRMLSVASAVCFPKSRIKFLDPQGKPGAPLQGQAIIYMGKNVAAFKAEFVQEGAVLFL